jgi:hypothetical protein
MIDEKAVRSRYEAMQECLNEVGRRSFAAEKRILFKLFVWTPSVLSF